MKIDKISGKLRYPLPGIGLRRKVVFLLIHHAGLSLKTQREFGSKVIVLDSISFEEVVSTAASNRLGNAARPFRLNALSGSMAVWTWGKEKLLRSCIGVSAIFECAIPWFKVNATKWQTNKPQNTKEPAELQL